MKSFEMMSKTGKAIRFEATYSCRMSDKVVDADGDRILLGKEPTDVGSMLTVYIDGEQVDSCWNPNFWRLIDLIDRPGVRKIWGLNIAFVEAETAAAYEAWIASVMEEGTDAEVKAYNAKKAEADKAEEIAYLERVIREAEQQETLPTAEEAAAQRKAYNDLQNEGGEGYVPRIISREQYDGAVKRLAELKHRA